MRDIKGDKEKRGDRRGRGEKSETSGRVSTQERKSKGVSREEAERKGRQKKKKESREGTLCISSKPAPTAFVFRCSFVFAIVRLAANYPWPKPSHIPK